MFLLDELKRQKGVSRKEYTRLNNSISESLDDAEDGEEEMGEDDGNEKEMVVDDDDDHDDDDDEWVDFPVIWKSVNVTPVHKKESMQIVKGFYFQICTTTLS